MKAAAFAALLLLVGCVPSQQAKSEAAGVQFVYQGAGKGHYQAYVFVAEPLTIRRLVLAGEGLVTDDPSCEPWQAVPGALRCAEGVAILAAPHGYRLLFEASGDIRGNVCLQREDKQTLLCKNLRIIPPAN